MAHGIVRRELLLAASEPVVAFPWGGARPLPQDEGAGTCNPDELAQSCLLSILSPVTTRGMLERLQLSAGAATDPAAWTDPKAPSCGAIGGAIAASAKGQHAMGAGSNVPAASSSSSASASGSSSGGSAALAESLGCAAVTCPDGLTVIVPPWYSASLSVAVSRLLSEQGFVSASQANVLRQLLPSADFSGAIALDDGSLLSELAIETVAEAVEEPGFQWCELGPPLLPVSCPPPIAAAFARQRGARILVPDDNVSDVVASGSCCALQGASASWLCSAEALDGLARGAEQSARERGNGDAETAAKLLRRAEPKELSDSDVRVIVDGLDCELARDCAEALCSLLRDPCRSEYARAFALRLPVAIASFRERGWRSLPSSPTKALLRQSALEAADAVAFLSRGEDPSLVAWAPFAVCEWLSSVSLLLEAAECGLHPPGDSSSSRGDSVWAVAPSSPVVEELLTVASRLSPGTVTLLSKPARTELTKAVSRVSPERRPRLAALNALMAASSTEGVAGALRADSASLDAVRHIVSVVRTRCDLTDETPPPHDASVRTFPLSALPAPWQAPLCTRGTSTSLDAIRAAAARCPPHSTVLVLVDKSNAVVDGASVLAVIDRLCPRASREPSPPTQTPPPSPHQGQSASRFTALAEDSDE
jgi:hypothetical protein